MITNEFHLCESELAPKAEGTRPYKIVLSNKFGQLAVHTYTPDDNGYHCGDYCGFDVIEAMKKYIARCDKHNLDIKSK